MSKFLALCVGLFIFWIAFQIKTADNATPPTPAKVDPRYALATVAASTIKSGLKNPASLAFEKVLIMPDGAVCFQYRARNSFNAVVPGQAVAIKDKISTSDGGGNFASLWNKHCFKKSGEDVGAALAWFF